MSKYKEICDAVMGGVKHGTTGTSDTTQQAEYWLIVTPEGYPICAGGTRSGAWRTLGMFEGSGALRAVCGRETELPADLRCIRVRVVEEGQ